MPENTEPQESEDVLALQETPAEDDDVEAHGVAPGEGAVSTLSLEHCS
ncbi:hypothetical protein Val02_47530 [Virgisporangium aliadipatigenens]|uniref:Uncharacterized protein n=1 Tax=Virgisporangium aliadipatigenens TaxID=741659 RepID=A0A8J3YNV7_9ACTN|nr:hypothetical protein [Virgisporangium aliadipatigenens]GIJ47867.1 hypothetical protein Val02_47530 [Virgisporangium aliadipatigenens]